MNTTIIEFKLPIEEFDVCGNLIWTNVNKDDKEVLFNHFSVTYGWASAFPEDDGISFSQAKDITVDKAADKLIDTFKFLSAFCRDKRGELQLIGKQGAAVPDLFLKKLSKLRLHL